MCVIAIQTIGAKISDERIRQLYASNPDGAGIMWAEGGKVHWIKGFFDVHKLIDAWHQVPSGVTAAIHCRITTHGGTCARLCHPFPLARRSKDVYRLKGTCNAVLMHNGIMGFMTKDVHYTKSDSDTSAYAKRLHELLGNARLPSTEDEMDFIREETEGSRILIMDGTGAFFTAGEWTWEDGILYSNTHFKWRSNYITSSKSAYNYNGGYGYTTGMQGYPKYNWDDDDDLIKYIPTKQNKNSGIMVYGSNSFRGSGTESSTGSTKKNGACATAAEKARAKWTEYEDLKEDEPEAPLLTECDEDIHLTKDEILTYAEDENMTPVDYYGRACWWSTGEEVKGAITDNLYCDAAFNIYELDEDTLVFALRSDMYLDEYSISNTDKEQVVSYREAVNEAVRDFMEN
jgi:predicted glutamine amidotransferase